MIATRITPKFICQCLAISLISRVGAYLVWLLIGTPVPLSRWWIAENALKTGFLCFAFFLALILNLEVAKEYRQTTLLRLAWLSLAANAGISVVRMIVESSLWNLAWPGYLRSPLWGLLQHLTIVPANLFLLLGLLTMWWAYSQVRLGFTVEARDYAAILGILVLIILLIIYRDGLSEARSPYVLSRWLQLGGLVLLSLSAAASCVLHRQAMQMGGGKLAVTLRFLAIYTLLRGGLVLIQAEYRVALLDGRSANSLYPVLFDLGWQLVPWIVALAAAHRVEMTTLAAKELQQQRASRAALVSA